MREPSLCSVLSMSAPPLLPDPPFGKKRKEGDLAHRSHKSGEHRRLEILELICRHSFAQENAENENDPAQEQSNRCRDERVEVQHLAEHSSPQPVG